MAADTPRPLLDHVLLPVATRADAEASAAALQPYEPAHVTVLHVVEKAGGAPDKTSPDQSHEIAESCVAAVRAVFPDASERTAYGGDVVESIFATAAEIDATAIAFRSRGGNRLQRLLAGDHALKLVTRSPRPVIALPRNEHEN